MKTCTACQQLKPLSQFSANASSPDGKRSQCKSCAKHKQDATDKHKVANREHYWNNLRYHKSRKLKQNYGITIEDYENLLSKQDFSCAVCGKHQETLSRSLVVDHDHKTGKVRGLLCHACNLSLGSLEDNVDRLQKMIHYLLK